MTNNLSSNISGQRTLHQVRIKRKVDNNDKRQSRSPPLTCLLIKQGRFCLPRAGPTQFSSSWLVRRSLRVLAVLAVGGTVSQTSPTRTSGDIPRRPSGIDKRFSTCWRKGLCLNEYIHRSPRSKVNGKEFLFRPTPPLGLRSLRSHLKYHGICPLNSVRSIGVDHQNVSTVN